MEAESPPRAIATGIVSPRCAIARQCAAPTLCRCQCIAISFLPRTCTRYIPTFLTPDSGSRVITPPSVTYGPPSSGQQIGTGSVEKSTSPALITVSWQGGRDTVLGGNFATSASSGSIASLPISESGTLRLSSSAMRAPISSSDATPSAIAMRRSEPNRFTATGTRDGAPERSVGFVKSSAGPPPGDFMQRSATSVISLSTETGRSTRASCPAASIAPMKSRRLSSAMVDGADAAGQELVAHVVEACGRQASRQRLRLGKGEHRLWQVGIGVPMFRDHSTDGWKNVAEVEQIESAEWREAGRRELENHEPRSTLQHPRRFFQAGVQVREVPDPEADERAVKGGVRERQRQRIGAHRHRPRRLAFAAGEHRQREIGAKHGAREAGAACQLHGEVEGAGAEIEIDARGAPFPVEPRDGAATPGAIDVEAEQMIEEIVTRRDFGEHAAHVGSRSGRGGRHR